MSNSRGNQDQQPVGGGAAARPGKPLIRVEAGDIAAAAADAVIVNLFEGVTQPGGATGAVNRALNGRVAALIREGGFAGELGEVAVIETAGLIPARHALIAGLGWRGAFDLAAVRRASAAAFRRAAEIGAKSVASIVHGGGIGGLDVRAAAEATAAGALDAVTGPSREAHEPQAGVSLELITLLERDEEKLAEVRLGASSVG